jgi:malonyl-CoA/methylmalonyl-CoA synthetase
MSDNLYELLASRFAADRSKACFRLSDGAAVSYGALEDGAACIAGQLVAKGVAPGDRVAVQAEKSPEAVMLYLATLKAGAVFTP